MNDKDIKQYIITRNRTFISNIFGVARRGFFYGNANTKCNILQKLKNKQQEVKSRNIDRDIK